MGYLEVFHNILEERYIMIPSDCWEVRGPSMLMLKSFDKCLHVGKSTCPLTNGLILLVNRPVHLINLPTGMPIDQ